MTGVRAWTTSMEHFSLSNARKLSGVYLFPDSAATPAFLFRWFFVSRLARQRLCPGNRIADFPRKPREDHVIRFAQQAREFLRRQGIPGLQRDPLRSRQVRRGNDVGPLGQLSEIFRRRFEREKYWRRLQRRYGEHLPAHFEYQIVAPLDLFRGAWKGKANLAQLIDVHEQDSRMKAVLASIDETEKVYWKLEARKA